MSQFFSPKEVAQAVGVSESSMKRWVDRGLVEASKTAGGHRRLQLDAVLDFLRRTGKPIRDPRAIALPDGCGLDMPTSMETARDHFMKSILAGDEMAARRIAVDVFVSGYSVSEMCDQMITPVFHDIGNLWQCGDVQIYEERRACEICQRTIHELRRAVKQGDGNKPLAMGGTLDGDPYTIATSLAELVLRDIGWRAESLGNMLPFDAIRTAIIEQRPKLFWISVTTVRDPQRFVADFNLLFDVAQSTGTALVAGGQGLTTDIRQQVRYSQFSDTYGHLESFGQGLFEAEVERAAIAARIQLEAASTAVAITHTDSPHPLSDAKLNGDRNEGGPGHFA